jgi:hypothetical protein
MGDYLPQKYHLGPTVRDEECAEILTFLKVEDKPLLETNQAIGLSFMALVILIIGGLVQVSQLLLNKIITLMHIALAQSVSSI